ncbi:hypothetical protein HYU11_03860 [Candidatus Woesearchaeota archaeon]|nr:hypothetical protein [Candidatus Woesearchaeota archaeon]
MSPEREIVNLWLNRKGFLTISGLNAGSRVIDFIAVKNKKDATVMHVEVSCSISASILFEKDRKELYRMFNDSNVVNAVNEAIRGSLGTDHDYENILVTNYQNLNIPNVNVVKFEDILFEIVKDMDKQKYRSQTIRTIQLIKYLLMSNPSRMAGLFNQETSHKAMTHSAKESLVKDLLRQELGRKVFSKQSNEQLLVEIIRASSLRNPERLANALEEVLTKRSGNHLLNILIKKKGIQTAIKEELEKDSKLEQFFKV